MLKVTVAGEVLSFDNDRYPLTEAIELEEKLGMTFAEWNRDFYRGSVKALCGLVWLALKRDGRGIPLADILSGKWPEGGGLCYEDIRVEMEGDEPGPTGASSPQDAGNTSEPSPSASPSGPGSGNTSP